MKNQVIIAVGKTKIVRTVVGKPYVVDIFSKDDITAGDGAKSDVLPGKGIYSTATTCNCFELLERNGVDTHFIRRVDDTTFRARNVEMIPIELVVRRRATGSYLKRNPEVAEGTRFDDLVMEFFHKDDENHDPFMEIDVSGKRILFYDAKKPATEGFVREEPIWHGLAEAMPHLVLVSKMTFRILERAWDKQGVTLVDLKIECGRDKENPDRILVSDVIDNDSWRIWIDGLIENMMDKQVYRNIDVATPEDLKEIATKYAWVANATSKFVVA